MQNFLKQSYIIFCCLHTPIWRDDEDYHGQQLRKKLHRHGSLYSRSQFITIKNSAAESQFLAAGLVSVSYGAKNGDRLKMMHEREIYYQAGEHHMNGSIQRIISITSLRLCSHVMPAISDIIIVIFFGRQHKCTQRQLLLLNSHMSHTT